MTELEESNQQLIGAWSRFADGFASSIVTELDGMTAAFARTALPFLNMVALNRPVADAGDLTRRIEAAIEFTREQGKDFFVSVCEDWIPPGLYGLLESLMSNHGLVPIMQWTGMAASQLEPEIRAPYLEIRPAEDDAGRMATMDLNCISYDMPVELGRESRGDDRLWHGLYGSVGYVEGSPVSTATAVPVAGRLYVAMVATHPSHRRRGYAEACMRDALARAEKATGFRRTVLHATNAGHPIYRRMGYRDTSRFTLFAREQ